MRKALVLPLAVGALIFAGCETSTRHEKINADQYWLCDDSSGDDAVDCGANPEKGLRSTCFKDGRTIAELRRLDDKSLIVTCGPKIR